MTVKRSILLLIVFLTFISCSARIDGVVREGGAAELTLKASLEPRTLALIRSLRNFMGGADDSPVLDGPSISRSMVSSSGIRSAALENTSSSALDGTISVADIGDFLSSTRGRLITFTEGREASSIVITLDKDSVPELISRLSPEAEGYLSALMAPAVLGETSTRQEYLDLVAAVYGRPLADEIADSRIRAFIEFPRPLTAVQGGNALGKQAEFDIPLLDILVLEHPLRYEVSW